LILCIVYAYTSLVLGGEYHSASAALPCLSSVVWNVRAPYSGDWNFRQCIYVIWYLGHPWAFGKNVTEIVPGEPLYRGIKPKSGSQI